MTDVVGKKFEDIPVSTKTFIVVSNLCLDIKKLSAFLPITEYIVVPKKRGRKKKTVQTDLNKNIPDGSIITIDPGTGVRGVNLKKKKRKDWFRNSVTIVMIIDEKKINFKISNNGKFQMTGVKRDSQAELCIKYIWSYIKDTNDIYKLPENEPLKCMFIPAMRNIDFNLGMIIDREKLDEYFNTQTSYCSLLETSIGYTGVNIKIPVSKPISELQIKRISYKDGAWIEPDFVLYGDYLEGLKPRDRLKKLSKDRFNTFLVFHSGKVIMSSMCEEFARDTFYEFVDIIKKNQKVFRENLQQV
jgi:TATA-box binding protein (TBP) (component of TFIID and TFIIIB)